MNASNPAETPAHRLGMLADAQAIWNSLRGLSRAHVQLATVEMRLTAESLVTMIAAGVMVAVLLVSAWFVVLTAAVLGLVGTGLSLSLAMLFAVVLNLLGAWILYGVAHHYSQHLGFPATVRSLGVDLDPPSNTQTVSHPHEAH